MKDFFARWLVGECVPMDNFLKPLLLFGFRFYVAFVFFKSGLTKVDDSFKVTSGTIDLFKYEFMPYVSEQLATMSAYLASYAELIIPIFLVLGLFTRPMALALFILNAVATYSLAQTDFASAAGHWQHMLWGTMLAVLFAFGPSRVSIDQWISDNILDRDTSLLMKIIMIAVLGGIGYYLATTYL